MKKLFLFFSHKNNFSILQEEDAKATLEVEAIVTLSNVVEKKIDNNKIEKVSVFEHSRFRVYA